jgi:SAM-dependent methyltransferase
MIITRLIGHFRKSKKLDNFQAIAAYWENRYKSGGDSGFGSYGNPAKEKANYINNTLRSFEIKSVIDFGCGDGNQLGLLELGNCSYLGIDIACASIQICEKKYTDSNLNFMYVVDFDSLNLPSCDLALSMDVIYHLTDNDTYFSYLDKLFETAKYVLIYSMDFDDPGWNGHSRPRKFSQDVSLRYPNFGLIDKTNSADLEQKYMQYFLYKKFAE